MALSDQMALLTKDNTRRLITLATTYNRTEYLKRPSASNAVIRFFPLENTQAIWLFLSLVSDTGFGLF